MNQCIDCDDHWDFYMVTDEVWAGAGLHWSARCCVACLERRLKRPLTNGDFMVCPANRLAWAAAGKLSVALEDERRREQQREQLRIFLGLKRRMKWSCRTQAPSTSSPT
jgi:hypothetical protein